MSVPDWAPATAGETVVWQGQPRKRVVHQGMAVGVVAALVVVAGSYLAVTGGLLETTLVAGVGGLLALVAFSVPAGLAWLWRWSTRYVLTDSALYHRTGVLSVTVTELSLGKIQNTSYAQSVLGTVFDFGTVTVDTAGSRGAELTLRALEGPQEVHRQIAEQSGATDGQRGDGIPGTIGQWRAVRDEVRRLRTALRTGSNR